MSGLLDWGGSNYPGETFLSPARRSRPGAPRARFGVEGGQGRGSAGPLPAPPRRARAPEVPPVSHQASCPLPWPLDSPG